MRLLNDTEKDFCKRILVGNGANNFLENIIDHKLGGVRISITKSPKKVELLLETQNQNPTKEEFNRLKSLRNNVISDITTVVNLIKMLERESYIILFNGATVSQNKFEFGQGAINLCFILSDIDTTDNVIMDLLIDYVGKEIVLTEEFREFCKNDYISREELRHRKEELRHRKEIKITKYALYVAIIALVVNVVFNIISIKSKEMSINQEQMSLLMKNLTTISNKLDSLIVVAKKDLLIDKKIEKK